MTNEPNMHDFSLWWSPRRKPTHVSSKARRPSCNRPRGDSSTWGLVSSLQVPVFSLLSFMSLFSQKSEPWFRFQTRNNFIALLIIWIKKVVMWICGHINFMFCVFTISWMVGKRQLVTGTAKTTQRITKLKTIWNISIQCIYTKYVMVKLKFLCSGCMKILQWQTKCVTFF